MFLLTPNNSSIMQNLHAKLVLYLPQEPKYYTKLFDTFIDIQYY